MTPAQAPPEKQMEEMASKDDYDFTPKEVSDKDDDKAEDNDLKILAPEGD